MSKHFEVYICKLDGNIIYIGSGANGRHKHCNSGCSHVYDLNKLHFEGKVFDIQVKKFNDKQDSINHEKDLILKHKPRFNSVYLSDVRNKKGVESMKLKRMFRQELLKYFTKDDVIESYSKAFLEFLHHHNTAEFVKNGVMEFHERCYYKNNVSSVLFSLYRSYLEGVASTNSVGYKFFCCVLNVLNSENGSNIKHVNLYP